VGCSGIGWNDPYRNEYSATRVCYVHQKCLSVTKVKNVGGGCWRSFRVAADFVTDFGTSSWFWKAISTSGWRVFKELVMTCVEVVSWYLHTNWRLGKTARPQDAQCPCRDSNSGTLARKNEFWPQNSCILFLLSVFTLRYRKAIFVGFEVTTMHWTHGNWCFVTLVIVECGVTWWGMLQLRCVSASLSLRLVQPVLKVTSLTAVSVLLRIVSRLLKFHESNYLCNIWSHSTTAATTTTTATAAFGSQFNNSNCPVHVLTASDKIVFSCDSMHFVLSLHRHWMPQMNDYYFCFVFRRFAFNSKPRDHVYLLRCWYSLVPHSKCLDNVFITCSMAAYIRYS
jgi:hypothetical protein